MGEIKSTIDLIMERTRGMTLSSDERASLRKEDFEKRAKGFRLRLLEDPSRAEEVLSSLNDEPPEDRTFLEALIWEEMVRNLPANQDIKSHIDAMERLPQAFTKGRCLGELRTLFKSGAKASAEERKKVIAREKKKLAAIGISGSAVLPKIPREAEADPDVLAVLNRCKKELLDKRPG